MTNVIFNNTLSLAEARRIALAAQGFGKQRSKLAPWPRVRQTIERMGLLQIDSISTIVRSHYLPVFSRIGAYDTTQFDNKAFATNGRELFEYWGHEASLLPFAMHPLLRWRMARAERLEGIYGGIAKLVQAKRDYIDAVFKEVHSRGPVSARELSDRGGGGWWTWHDGKTALEYLFWTGKVTTAERRGFERVYDLTERVLPPEIIDLPTPTDADAQRQLVNIAARALGVATETDLRDYFRLSAADAKRSLAALVESGDLLPITVEGWVQPAFIQPDTRIPRRIRTAALLSPFDPLVWERARTERLFDFHYRIEIYTPAAKRRFGYYVLPFLLDEKLVARIDLKADRPAGVLRVLAAYAESGAKQAHVADALAQELRRLADWLGLERIVLEQKGDLTGALKQCLLTL